MKVVFVYFDYDGTEYWKSEKEIPYVPSEGDEVFLDTEYDKVNYDGWIVLKRIYDIKLDTWLLSIKHRNDDFGKGIFRFKELMKLE